MLTKVSEEKPDIVCLSALPPFAVGHARRLHQQLHTQFPDLKIVIGLWNCTGGPKQAESRISGVADSQVIGTLAQAMQQIRFLTDGVAQSAET
jgi:hypothetical protein